MARRLRDGFCVSLCSIVVGAIDQSAGWGGKICASADMPRSSAACHSDWGDFAKTFVRIEVYRSGVSYRIEVIEEGY